MIRGEFRPWGLFAWLRPLVSLGGWSLIGSIATGERSLAAWQELTVAGACDSYLLLEIKDIPAGYWGQEPELRLQERRQQFLSLGGSTENIETCNILDTLDEIHSSVDKFIALKSANVVVDITSLPKRFFFPLLQRMLQESDADNIVVTYTRPSQYDRDKPLAIDPESWRPLPGFSGPIDQTDSPMLVVGLGYEPLGLPQILKEGEFARSDIRLLFPFPAAPAGYRKNWEFVRKLDSDVGPYNHEPIRINGYDVSANFEQISAITGRGKRSVVFAPYGTKAMSLAMCLFAVAKRDKCGVFYTQPTSYNPNYSRGISKVESVSEIFAYSIRLNRRNLYQLA